MTNYLNMYSERGKFSVWFEFINRVNGFEWSWQAVPESWSCIQGPLYIGDLPSHGNLQQQLRWSAQSTVRPVVLNELWQVLRCLVMMHLAGHKHDLEVDPLVHWQPVQLLKDWAHVLMASGSCNDSDRSALSWSFDSRESGRSYSREFPVV